MVAKHLKDTFTGWKKHYLHVWKGREIQILGTITSKISGSEKKSTVQIPKNSFGNKNEVITLIRTFK